MDGAAADTEWVPEALGFGQHLGDLAVAATHDGAGWSELRLVPRADLAPPMAGGAVQYALSVFEGLKAYRDPAGGVHLFRPRMHARRLVASATRLGLQPVDEALFIEGCVQAVRAHLALLPPHGRGALYLRPTLHVDGEFLGLRAPRRHGFSVLLSPCSDPVLKRLRLWAEPELIRAARGGLGAAKTGANYAAGLAGLLRAQQRGYDDVAWLDADDHCRLAEAGSMNLFVRVGDRLLTPPLDGCILAGVTRDSLLHLAADEGLQLAEAPLDLDQLMCAERRGVLGSAFGCGTAARIAQIDEIGNVDYRIRFADDGLPQRLSARLKAAQEGADSRYAGWWWGV